MLQKSQDWNEARKAAVVAKMTDDTGELYVLTIVMVAGAVLLGFLLISIFDVLFGGVIT